METPKPPNNLAKSLGIGMAVLTDLVAFTGIGIAAGYYVWSRWGAPWWVLLLLSLGGLSLSFYRLYLLSKKDLD